MGDGTGWHQSPKETELLVFSPQTPGWRVKIQVLGLRQRRSHCIFLTWPTNNFNEGWEDVRRQRFSAGSFPYKGYQGNKSRIVY